MPKYHGYLRYEQQYEIEAENDKAAMDKLENISMDLDSYNFIRDASEELEVVLIREE